MRLLRAAAISMIGVTACTNTSGKSGKDLAVASQPGGAQVTVTLGGRAYTGELLAVRDDGVIVVTERQLSYFPFASLGGLVVAQMDNDYRLSAGERPASAKLRRLRIVSHFPQGLTPEIERRLLAEIGQAALVTVQ